MSEQEKIKSYRLVLPDISQDLSNGSVEAGFTLGLVYHAELPSNDANLHMLVGETLIRQSAALGCSAAQEYLDTTWPEFKPLLEKRLVRKGMKS